MNETWANVWRMRIKELNAKRKESLGYFFHPLFYYTSSLPHFSCLIHKFKTMSAFKSQCIVLPHHRKQEITTFDDDKTLLCCLLWWRKVRRERDQKPMTYNKCKLFNCEIIEGLDLHLRKLKTQTLLFVHWNYFQVENLCTNTQ